MSRSIRHMVAVRFRPDIDQAHITEIMDQLSELRAHLSGVTDFQHRPNVSVEELAVHGFRHLFWFDFDDESARDAYLVDADHIEIGKKLIDAANGGVDGILVLDFTP